MVACSQKVIEIGSILDSFWRSKSLLHRFLRDSKKQQKTESIFGRFRVQKRGLKSFQNRYFFVVFSEPCLGGSASRFLIDFGLIFDRFWSHFGMEFWWNSIKNVRHARQLLINVLWDTFVSAWLDAVAEKTEMEKEREVGRGRRRERERERVR